MSTKPTTTPAPASTKPAVVAVAKPSRMANGPSYASMQAARTHSTVASPVAAMWALCNTTIGQSRKAVVLAATQAGISYHTARTQYQAWLKAAQAAAVAAAAKA